MKPKQRYKVSNYLYSGAITLSVLAVISCLIPLTTKLSLDILQILNVARYGLSVLSIVITIISLIILPDRLFISIALILSVVAIFWNYVVIGVAVGVAIAVAVIIFQLWEEGTSWW
jgi:hypothetical protein